MNEISYQRWLAVGLLAFVSLLLVFLILVPVITTVLDNREQTEELLFRLQRARQIVAGKDEMTERIELIKQAHEQNNYFSNRDTVALASADLQRLIKSAVSQAGGELTSTQVLPVSNEQGLTRVMVQVRMAGDIAALRSVLYEIESSVPLMIIDQIDIRPVRGKRNRKTRKIEPSNKLNVNFRIIGFMRAKTL
jgi:general secretion pathway protein M